MLGFSHCHYHFFSLLPQVAECISSFCHQRLRHGKIKTGGGMVERLSWGGKKVQCKFDPLLITQLLKPSFGEMIASMALGRVGTALALVSQHTFAPLIGMKEMIPHRRSRDCVHLIAWNTFVFLAHSCSCKGTALTSPTSSFQYVWTRMVTFWEEICKNEVVPMSGEWGVACKGRTNFYLKHNP